MLGARWHCRKTFLDQDYRQFFFQSLLGDKVPEQFCL
jgi:hypothetical protein